ncbi:MAG: alpha-D-quinac alpha-1,3-galactosyltransferase [Alteromonas sp.]|nr:alpha-D-quinac alpha-1,3-galactosyltransferase [Alteromonas sp.]MAY22871.1 alpha-D-quinac alpha-1,3-galactosyltransferase [Flavobacteriaceae bacterium]
MKKLLITANVDWFFISHRLCIAEAVQKAGWEVIVAAEDTGRSNEITQLGIQFVNFPFSRSGTNPLKEIQTVKKFYNLYKTLQPDVVHHITLKPVIYGSLAAKKLKIGGVLNAISGLGYVFTDARKGPVQKIMVKLMKKSFKRPNVSFIFQNQDDYQELKALSVFSDINKIHFIKGSGVNLTEFKQSPLPNGERVKVLFPTRMLWDKGVAELREATNLLKKEFHDKITFILAGLADEENKAGVSADYLRDWEDGDYVKWIGYQTQMVSVYSDSDMVVLPSYREGMPKTLIEACAIGRPIVTTTAIGCRECVDEGVNGFKVPVKSSEALANAIQKLVMDSALRQQMGTASRKKAEAEFDQKQVIAKHLSIYNALFNEKNSNNG